MLHSYTLLKMGIFFLFFWGPQYERVNLTFPNFLQFCHEHVHGMKLGRRGSQIEFCAQHPQLTLQCNAGAWIFRRAISSIQQENPILGEQRTARINRVTPKKCLGFSMIFNAKLANE